MDFNRMRYVTELDRLYEDGEITEEEYYEKLAEWDEGYEAAQEQRWEMGCDR